MLTLINMVQKNYEKYDMHVGLHVEIKYNIWTLFSL